MESSLIEKMRINRQMRLICLWCAIPMMVLLFGGLTISGFISPIHPSASAAEVAHQYRTNTDAIRIGLAISFAGVIFLLPFGAAIAAQTRRIESLPSVLTYTQTAAFAAGSLIFVIPWVCWQTAAFRPERADSEILLLNDLGWICFVFAYVAFTTWLFAIGLAILSDTGKNPVYPRWLGYYNFFVALTFIPDNLIPFFKTGPFDWRGVFPYWFPFAMYGIWILVMVVQTVKSINRETAGEQAEPRTAEDAHPDPARLARTAT